MDCTCIVIIREELSFDVSHGELVSAHMLVVGPFNSGGHAEEWLKVYGWQYSADCDWSKKDPVTGKNVFATLKDLTKPDNSIL